MSSYSSGKEDEMSGEELVGQDVIMKSYSKKIKKD